jgi:hypothetical protein
VSVLLAPHPITGGSGNDTVELKGAGTREGCPSDREAARFAALITSVPWPWSITKSPHQCVYPFIGASTNCAPFSSTEPEAARFW